VPQCQLEYVNSRNITRRLDCSGHICIEAEPLHFTFPSFCAFMMLLPYILPFFAVTAQAALTYKGVDWSSLLVEEAAGKTYKTTSGTTALLESILKSSGVNTVRQRLWVNPSDENYNLAYNIKLAQRAKAAGLAVYLDLHFSDTWADPAHQVSQLHNIRH
jgi:arabinogalactan endo-1,4-beta-galactosidase